MARSSFDDADTLPIPWRQGRDGGLRAVLAALLVPLAAAAQEPDSVPRDSVFTVPGLTVNVTRSVTTAGGTAAVDLRLDSVDVVPAPTMDQVLRRMPLILIRENSRGEAQPAVRGSEDRQIAVLVDGVPLTYGWDNRTDLSIIPLTAAENVRLIRGLSSVLHGPNVLGGVVEVEMASGERPLTPPRPIVVEGGVDHTGATQIGASGGAMLGTSWVVRGGAGYRRRDGQPLSDRLTLDPGDREELLTADGDLRLNSDLRHVDGFVSARHQAAGGQWLSFGGSAYATERGVPPEVNEAEPRLWRYPEQTRVLAAMSGGTGHQATRWGVGDLEASVGLDLQHFAIDEYGSAAFDEVTAGETGDTRTLSVRFLGDHTLGPRGQVRGSFTYGDVAHEELLLPDRERADYRQRLWSVATEADWALSESRATSVSAGIALDGSDTPESGDKPPLGTLWDWGGRLGVSSLVTDGVLLNASVSRRTRFPSLRELYSGALGRFLPNPGLRPESLVGTELGVTLRQDAWELQAVGFHHRIDDGIVRVSVDTDEGVKRQRVNQNRIRATGLEILASGSLAGLDYAGDLTLQRVRLLDEDGTQVKAEYQPDVFGKLALGGRLPWRLAWSATGRVIGAQFCTTTTESMADTLGASAALDVGLRRVFRLDGAGGLSSVDVLAAVDNAADSGYYDQCGLPQPGRRFRVQFRLL